MARVSVFLSDRLLGEINQQVREEGSSRGEIIQPHWKSISKASGGSASKLEEKRKKMQEACS